ncbi:MAG: hypothetical protein P8M04_02865 [Akkermansiaceae bacterium]|nr:hypothetical protein [Akkermansiaceae bacterium]
MKFTKNDTSTKSSKGVRKPVTGIVTGSIVEKGLMKFIPNSNQ